MTDITILGSGRVAVALASKWVAAGHRTTLGSRDPAAAESQWQGPAVQFALPEAAVCGASIVINATPGDTSVERLGALREAFSGKILIDVANATVRTENGAPGGLCYPASSLAEKLQETLPETKVVKTLNTMLFTVMADPTSLKAPAIVFLSGDDGEAKAQVRALLGDLGWAPEQVMDLGSIETARGVEAFILLVPAIVRAHGFAPFALSVAR
jgi:predicted dinucleotide-binding enzyme